MGSVEGFQLFSFIHYNVQLIVIYPGIILYTLQQVLKYFTCTIHRMQVSIHTPAHSTVKPQVHFTFTESI